VNGASGLAAADGITALGDALADVLSAGVLGAFGADAGFAPDAVHQRIGYGTVSPAWDHLRGASTQGEHEGDEGS
jgi:hypothetical protein